MQMTGERRIAATRERVWQALNDPDVLRRSIPGCQSLDKEGDNRLRATVEVKVGPIGARFNGAVTLSDINPPNGYTIAGEGQGGTVGSAKGSAKVRLASEAGGTLLSYEVDAQVGGRLAQLGGPLIDATAKQLADRFFRQFGEIVAGPAKAEPETKPATATAPASDYTGQVGASPQRLPIFWVLALAVSAIVSFLIGRGAGVAGLDWISALGMGVLVAIVAIAGFEVGRRASVPMVMLDPALLARLTEGKKL